MILSGVGSFAVCARTGADAQTSKSSARAFSSARVLFVGRVSARRRGRGPSVFAGIMFFKTRESGGSVNLRPTFSRERKTKPEGRPSKALLLSSFRLLYGFGCRIVSGRLPAAGLRRFGRVRHVCVHRLRRLLFGLKLVLLAIPRLFRPASLLLFRVRLRHALRSFALRVQAFNARRSDPVNCRPPLPAAPAALLRAGPRLLAPGCGCLLPAGRLRPPPLS